MANRYRLVMTITFTLGGALFITSMLCIWLNCASSVTRWWNATTTVFATMTSSISVTTIILVITLYRMSLVGTCRLTSIVLTSSSSISTRLLILVLLGTLSVSTLCSCILICITIGALLGLLSMLSIGIQTVVVLVALILIMLLTILLVGRIVLSAPSIASGRRRIAFVFRIHV